MKINWETKSDKAAHETHRVFKMSTGGEVHFRRLPPQSFWTVAYGKGAIPPDWQGRYIAFSRALKAVEKYLAAKGTTIEEIPVDAA